MQPLNEASETLDKPKKSGVADAASLRLSAMNMLAMREHSRFELAQKLLKKSDDMELIEQALDKLVSDNLLCDNRFALMFVRSKANSGFGPYKIKQELKVKGVSKVIIGDAIKELDINWFEVATSLYKKRIERVQELDMKEKHKQSRYLQNRGFSGETVREVIGDSLD